MYPVDVEASLRVTVIGPLGEPDDFGEAHLCDDGIVLEAGLSPDTLGITWADLARILQHPYAQERLEEAEDDL